MLLVKARFERQSISFAWRFRFDMDPIQIRFKEKIAAISSPVDTLLALVRFERQPSGPT
jgi:hypothetical protein